MADRTKAATPRSHQNRTPRQSKDRKSLTQVAPAPKPRVTITHEMVARARATSATVIVEPVNPFKPLTYPPATSGGSDLAMDEACGVSDWAFQSIQSIGGYAGTAFIGYPLLAELAQRPEYRRISETIARHMTRKWIKFKAKGDEDKTDKIAQLDDAMKRYGVRDAFRELAEQDGFFGRSHLYADLGSDDPDELKTSIVDGLGKPSKAKIAKGSLRRFKTVEAVWCAPMGYNSNNPLDADFYKPTSWLVMGKQIHASRFMTFVGREVPDLLKPAYSFGGMSLSQMLKPYVENWLRTRKSVSDLINAFCVFVLKTNLVEQVAASGAGDGLFQRLSLFNALKDNLGVMALDKEAEEFENISAPLGTLDSLQAQALEQICSISAIPIVEYTGDQPSGLNASSDGALRTFFDNIHSSQESLFRPNLTQVIGIIQLSEFGEIDPDIVFDFEPLWSMSEKERADVELVNAQTGAVLIESGALLPEEERKRVASDEDTQYPGLDLSLELNPPTLGEQDDLPAPPEPPKPELKTE